MTETTNEEQEVYQAQDTSSPAEAYVSKKKPRYAGFWMRFWAYLADVIIVFSINGILLSPIPLLTGGSDVDISYWTLHGILAAFVFYIYFVVMTKLMGQTVGKMIFGIKVVRSDAKPLTWKDLLFREVIGRFIHKVFFFFSLLYIVVAFNPKKQGIHDMFGNTNVVHLS